MVANYEDKFSPRAPSERRTTNNQNGTLAASLKTKLSTLNENIVTFEADNKLDNMDRDSPPFIRGPINGGDSYVESPPSPNGRKSKKKGSPKKRPTSTPQG